VGGADGVRLLLLIESPAGIAAAVAIGRAAPHLEALCFGHADFSLQMGLGDADASRGVVYHARCTLAIAARACGIAPIDSVFLAVRDDAAFREDAALGCRLGFDGKLCIHPRQVEIVNDVYTPGPEQVEYANRVVEAWAQAAAEGRGVFALDGRMIDAPVVAVQRQVLARARRAGVRGAARV
jgi:citrate lyase subunit beta/citryl-CoA lyase